MRDVSSNGSKLKSGKITKSFTSLIFSLTYEEVTLKISFKQLHGPSINVPQFSLFKATIDRISIAPVYFSYFPNVKFSPL